MKKALLITFVCFATILSFVAFAPNQQFAIIEKSSSSKELPKMNKNAFKRGELLKFRLHYGIIDAGIATLSVTEEQKELGGRKTMHVVGLGSSKGAFDFFYRVRDRYETYIDEEAMIPWVFVRRVNEGGYKIEQDYMFNHYSEKVNVGGGEVFEIQPNMQDMLSAFYHARNLDLSNATPGEMYSINCFMDKEVWPLQIKFICKENITTDLGTFRCLKFRPIVQKGRVFKREEDLNIWITDDKNHIPILGQADVLVGSIKAELTSYSGLANEVAKIK
jgi:hypothetical protein